jgi:hypothetical protein
MQEEQALDFYDRIVSGKDGYNTISLEHSSGAVLEDVQMHPVSKRVLAGVIERLPEELFESVEGAENPEEAEEEFEDGGGNINAVTESTVEAFEDLCAESLSHEELTSTHMKEIIAELNFEVLFELGTEIINMSIEDTGGVKDFQKQT